MWQLFGRAFIIALMLQTLTVGQQAVVAEDDEEDLDLGVSAFRKLARNVLRARDPTGIQKALFYINQQEFCVLPRQSHIGKVFLEAFFRDHNIDLVKIK